MKRLKREGIRRPIYSNSKEDMTPGYDKAFVLVSGGIYLHEKGDMEGIYLRSVFIYGCGSILSLIRHLHTSHNTPCLPNKILQ